MFRSLHYDYIRTAYADNELSWNKNYISKMQNESFADFDNSFFSPPGAAFLAASVF